MNTAYRGAAGTSCVEMEETTRLCLLLLLPLLSFLVLVFLVVMHLVQASWQ